MKKDKAPRISKELITRSAINLIVDGQRPSFRNIAKDLGCAAPSIFYYFKNLEAINISICDYFFCEAAKAIEESNDYVLNYELFIDDNKKIFVHIIKEFCDFSDSEYFFPVLDLIDLAHEYSVGRINGEKYLQFQLEGTD